MSTPLFSVLICTVGKEALTRGAIASILDQGVPDVEVIVTDTSGTDAIRDVCASFNDPRISFFEVPNLDPTLAWEFAYEQSTGRYVLWYDDDNRLIPGALHTYAALIAQEDADIVSANHAYYYGEGNRHQPELSNALSVLLPYSGNARAYASDALLKVVYDLSMGLPPNPARWHSAATFVSRAICEQAREEIGYVIAPHMYGNFTFHPVIFNYARKPLYYDAPLCIIGKFSSSITQQWSNAFVKQVRSSALPYRFSGVSERTLGNTTIECYLKVRHDLPAHERYPFNWERFYRRYLNELLFLNVPLGRHLRAWHEAWRALGSLKPASRRALRRQLLKQFAQSIGLRTFRVLGIWEHLRLVFKKRLPSNKNRVALPLAPYGIRSIDECAKRLTEILAQEGLFAK